MFDIMVLDKCIVGIRRTFSIKYIIL